MTRSAPQRSNSHAQGLRSLPSVNELAAALEGVSHGGAVRAARRAVEAGRDRIRAGQPPGELESDARARASARLLEAAAKSGGALPLLELTGPARAVDPAPHALDELARRLRVGPPSLLGRVLDGRLLLDPRTLTDDEARRAAAAVIAALA